MTVNAYFPGPGGQWERRRPDEVGLSADGLAAAVAHAEANETHLDRDLFQALDELTEGEGRHSRIVGPTKPRGGPAGLITRGGYIVAEWVTRHGWT